MRRFAALLLVLFVAYLGFAGIAANPAVAQDATPESLTGHPLVGAWVLDADPDDPANAPELIVFTADGLYIGVAADGSNTIGAWEATGPRGAAITLHFFIPGENDGFGGMATVRGNVEVAEDGQSFTAPYTLEFAGADGAGSGEYGPLTASGTRIAVEPMGEPIGPLSVLFGTPAAGTPAP
jgi:hypothetical protein